MSIRGKIAGLGWRLSGYRLVGEALPPTAGIVSGAPHTSNWDFVAFLGVSWSFDVPMKVLVKKSWFRGPLAPLLRALGGVPVDRDNPQNVVADLVAAAEQGSRFKLVIAPKGTRKQRPYWKSGFYRIAHQAGLPLTLASIDGARREVEVGPTLQLSGDVGSDMDLIRQFYADKAGVHPQLRCEPRLREEQRPES